jgi:hypothetical protein
MDITLVIYEEEGTVDSSPPDAYAEDNTPEMWDRISEFLETSIRNYEDLANWKDANEDVLVEKFVYIFEITVKGGE